MLLALLAACAARVDEEPPATVDPGDPAPDGAAGRSGGRPGTAGNVAGAGGRGGGGAGAGGAGGIAGGGGGTGGGTAGSMGAGAAGPVVITELMYHPVLEEAVERHEFIELHNRTDAAVSLRGWKLDGDARYAFADDATIGPRQYVVVAKDRAALRALAKYELQDKIVVGDYTGQLDNGGGRIAVLDAGGAVVDAVKFDDELPWPLDADALGASESWLRPALKPLSAHRFMGVSLERVSADVPASEVANWVPSPVDGATPGRKNTPTGAPAPIVESFAVAPDAGDGPVAPGKRAAVRVTLSARGAVAAPTVEWFVDAVERADEKPASVALAAAAGGGLEAFIPAQPANSIVRFRITGDRGKGPEVLSPRPTDPFPWHGYVVEPPAATATRAYHLFVAPADWGKLHDNVKPGRATGCTVNARWNDTVPAVFAHGGRLYDVQIRYVGSYIHRLHGLALPAWPHPGPASGPNPPLVLSYKVSFPRWSRFEGQASITLNKRWQSCPGVEWHVEGSLMRAAGIPAVKVRFPRVYINGGYYQYMMEIERVNDEFLERVFANMPLGDLFKNDGTVFGDQGPWGPGDGRVLPAACGLTSAQRMDVTYPRKTHAWKGKSEKVTAMLQGLAAARTAGGETLRAFLAKTFDVDAVLGYIAVKNWSGAWDDAMHNFFLYERPDGKWIVIPWDFDQGFGIASAQDGNAARTPASSFYLGENGVPENKLGWSHIKDAFFKAYRNEYHARLVALSKTVLAPDNVIAQLEAGLKEFSLAEATATPAKPACDQQGRIDAIRRWAPARHAVLQQRYGN